MKKLQKIGNVPIVETEPTIRPGSKLIISTKEYRTLSIRTRHTFKTRYWSYRVADLQSKIIALKKNKPVNWEQRMAYFRELIQSYKMLMRMEQESKGIND